MLCKDKIQSFFDVAAPNWDAKMIRSNDKISAILDAAGVKAGSEVLDVACGTGILINDYLQRDVHRVTGVDFSAQMINIAKSKYNLPNVEFLCADAEFLESKNCYNCVVVYNAFPHFINPVNLIERLYTYLKVGGRVCIAHGMSREALEKHHQNHSQSISLPLPKASELAKMMGEYFVIDTQISDEEKYIVAGYKGEENIS